MEHELEIEEYTIELDRSKENLKNLQQKVKASKKSIDNLVKEEEKRNSKFNALVLVLGVKVYSTCEEINESKGERYNQIMMDCIVLLEEFSMCCFSTKEYLEYF